MNVNSQVSVEPLTLQNTIDHLYFYIPFCTEEVKDLKIYMDLCKAFFALSNLYTAENKLILEHTYEVFKHYLDNSAEIQERKKQFSEENLIMEKENKFKELYKKHLQLINNNQ